MFGHVQLAAIVGGSSGWLLGVLTERVTTGDVLVIVAALVFALSTWRTSRNKTLQEDNVALRGRIQTLESENARQHDEKNKYLAELLELKARPDYRELVEVMREIRTAVVPPNSLKN